jgi:hypothetical protein
MSTSKRFCGPGSLLAAMALPVLAACGGAPAQEARGPDAAAGSRNDETERQVEAARSLAVLQVLAGKTGGAVLTDLAPDAARTCSTTEAKWSFTLMDERFLGPAMREADDRSVALRKAFSTAVASSRVRELEACLPKLPKLGFLAIFEKNGRVSVHAASSLEENKHYPPRRLTAEQRACAEHALSGSWFPGKFFEGQATGLVEFESSRHECGRASLFGDEPGEALGPRDYADRVAISVVSVDGALSSSGVARSLERRVDAIGACYFEDEEGELRDRDEPRAVKVRFEVNEGGQTVMPKVVGIDEPATARCIAITIVRTRFSSSDPRSTIRLRIAFDGDGP